jgi:hypothetical protein
MLFERAFEVAGPSLHGDAAYGRRALGGVSKLTDMTREGCCAHDPLICHVDTRSAGRAPFP